MNRQRPKFVACLLGAVLIVGGAVAAVRYGSDGDLDAEADRVASDISTTRVIPTSEPVSSTTDPPPTSNTAPTSTEGPAAIPGPTLLATTPDGRFNYFAEYESSIVLLNGTLLVDDGSGRRPALRDVRDQFDDIRSMVFGPDALVAWMSQDYQFGSRVFVGRVDNGGQIIDAHQVGAREEMNSVMSFNDSGELLGESYDGSPVAIDTASDPFFVMSASPVPRIDTDHRLVEEIESGGYWARVPPGSWYRGETLGVAPACGASTLYRDDADGFARVLAASTELDEVTAVHAAEPFGTGGADSVGVARAIVLSTVCPERYVGRRLYWGIESINYGDGGPRLDSPVLVEPVDHGPVAQVVGVVLETVEDGCCPWPSRLLIDVEFLNGATSVIEVDASVPSL